MPAKLKNHEHSRCRRSVGAANFLLGIPFDANSSYLRGPAQAPKAIREELHSGSSNLWTEDGIDLGRQNTFHEAGDVAIPDGESAFAAIEAAVKQTLDLGYPLICLSGDHSVTYPTIKAFHSHYPDLTILHFDAHPDLYDELDGNRLSHACPFARIMEERLARRLVQVGIRTINRHQLSQAAKFGVEVITMRNLDCFSKLSFEGPLLFLWMWTVSTPPSRQGSHTMSRAACRSERCSAAFRD